jgi:ATP-binding cassette, subfamily G (WHITE), member 2, SNQ2
MLEVIGAGATATSEIEWHGKWVESEEALGVQKELEHIHEEGRSRPPVAGMFQFRPKYWKTQLSLVMFTATFQSEFATSWLYQVVTLLSRNATHYWRDPTYVMSKLALNICGGLFIGFTFWQSSNSQQGIQSKLFVRLRLRCFEP